MPVFAGSGKISLASAPSSYPVVHGTRLRKRLVGILSRASLAKNELDTAGVQGKRKHDGYEVAIAKARVKTSGTTCLQRRIEKVSRWGIRETSSNLCEGDHTR